MDKKRQLSFFIVVSVLIAAATLTTIAYFILRYKNTSSGNNEPVSNTDPESIYVLDEEVHEEIQLKDIELSVDNYINIDGSTSTQPIRSLITCEVFDLECFWYETDDRQMFIEFNPGESDLSVDDLSKIRTVNSRTHGAYMALINKDTDLILVSTLPSEDEAQAAREAGIELEVTPIGLDAFVFIVNEANPMDNLKTEEVVDIYTGDITKWEEVGEWDAPIEPYVRNRNSGSQELMNRFIMKDKEMGDFPEPTSQFKAMAPLIDGVSTNQYSIGYTLFYYKLNMIDRRERMNNVKVLALDGIAPSEETISSKEYPHVFNIYAVVRKDLDRTSSEYKIKQWLTSDQGQSLIREAGYVRLY